uniref:Cartilage intermediate layer protein n=1 Tax=Pelodiscus sinensis TaxID=13735 RepID=K7G3D4_PELSI|nr:cartilage intermediate layer protein 1 isoform X1 [Pelodiscus sinensis]|eukprot:XP_006129247.1 cartilage intermediate layer protein 1 isoform X1 [Pelodiscus sinensis]
MIAARGWVFSLLLLEATSVLHEGERVWKQSGGRIQPRQRALIRFVKHPPADPGEWTSWFSVDHPGGNGDYERLDAIRFYFRDRVCERPTRMEARTTDWVPAQNTGQVVHASLPEGFWCLNKEQPAGKTCLNYAVRFLCPTGSLLQDSKQFWSPWSTWSACSAPCGKTGVQTRIRTCLAESRLDLHCKEATEEGRLCFGHSCAECNLTCSMGRVNAECNACMCEDHVLHGRVALADGMPATEATVYLQSENLKLLTETDSNGGFRIPGMCPDGKNILKIKKVRYATATVPVPESTEKSSIIHVRLKRADKPYMVNNPVDKVRKIGQTVALCCKAVGNPAPDQYRWYHNGTLLDSSVYKYNSKLVLRNLNMDQAGEYFCKASSDAGSVKSQAATLSVIATDEAFCNPRPESYFIRLPHDCFQNTTNSFYYDVGKCPAHKCAGKTDIGFQCKDSTAYCCGVSKMETREIECRGYTLPTKVAVECDCGVCTEVKTTVRGRATATDNGEPMRFGHIYLGNKRIGMTGYKGNFAIQIPADTERLVLTFVDRLQKFVNTTKVLPFNKKGGAVFHEIKLLRKQAPVMIESSETNTIPLGDMEGDDPIAELEIPPNTFYRQNGELYTGKVKASITFLDPRNMSTATAAQSDLNYISEEGDMLPLHTYGMFSMDFTDETASESLNAGKVKVHLDSAQVRIPEHLQQIKLWSLNPETGLWEEEGDFEPDTSTRRKREERTFLVGNMEIRERRLFNLDVPESRRCYVKVRAYRSERFLPSEQVEGVVISIINMEPAAGFSSNPRAWGRFDSAVTGPNGACLPAFCDEQRPDAYSAYIMASLRGEELEVVSSSPRLNPHAIGVPQPYLNKLNYRRTDHIDPRIKKTAFSITVAKPSPSTVEESNGPIYAAENLRECEQAHYSAAHFRFYRVEGDRYDYNTVPFNENDPMSWTEDYQAWWPNPMEYRACYIKVKINGPQEVNVRSRNMGGTHPYTAGKLYGIRDVRTIRDMEQPNLSTVCLEFKCSGMLYDQDRVDRTLVRIIPQGNCYRESVNSMLQEYLVNHLPFAVNNKSGEYTMLAPLDPLGHNYGIYTVTDQNPSIAKEIALGRCFDGTSDGTSRAMKSDVGIALTFNCAEKEVAQQSLFQPQQNSAKQGERPRIRRRQRETCTGHASMRRVTQCRSLPRV